MDSAEVIAREADRIVNLILFSDLPWIDIAIMAERLRERVAEEFPDKGELFEHLYARRFERIWSDWREG